MNLNDLIELDRQGQATIAVEEYGQVVHVSRATAYQAVRRGDVKAVRVSGRWRVVVKPLLRALGVEADQIAVP